MHRDSGRARAYVTGLKESQSLCDPRDEHDAGCIGLVANIRGRKPHDTTAVGADPLVGDCAGCLIQMPARHNDASILLAQQRAVDRRTFQKIRFCFERPAWKARRCPKGQLDRDPVRWLPPDVSGRCTMHAPP
jgi:hypothetical protein